MKLNNLTIEMSDHSRISKKIALKIEIKDNVATALKDLEIGDTVIIKSEEADWEICCKDAIPFGFKIAISDIKQGDVIVKYGYPIGKAINKITNGQMVHVHNICGFL